MKCSLCPKVALYECYNRVGFCGDHKAEAMKQAVKDRSAYRAKKIRDSSNSGTNMAARGGTRRGSGHSNNSFASHE